MPKQPSILGGLTKSIPAYYEGQNANGLPDHYESVDDANRLKSSGKAKSIHRGTALLIRGKRRLTDSTRDSVKSGWRVVGQTGRGKAQDGPGCPRWGSVGKRTR